MVLVSILSLAQAMVQSPSTEGAREQALEANNILKNSGVYCREFINL